MSIKIILVPISGNLASLTALNRALLIAKRFGAHVKGLHVMARAADVALFEVNVPAKFREGIKASAEQSAKEQAENARAGFELACQQAGVELSAKPVPGNTPTASWHQELGRVEGRLVNHARLSDLIVVPRPVKIKGTLGRSPVGRAIEAMLCGAGRPVLIEPPQMKVEECDRVVIGWNNSTEASRAIAMTWPWLDQVSKVTVLSSKKREAGSNDLIEYLSWHGVDANTVFLDGKGRNIGEAMLNVCEEQKAGLMIVGGFSHARARELLFGGVTRHLLLHSNIPTVMVH